MTGLLDVLNVKPNLNIRISSAVGNCCSSKILTRWRHSMGSWQVTIGLMVKRSFEMWQDFHQLLCLDQGQVIWYNLITLFTITCSECFHCFFLCQVHPQPPPLVVEHHMNATKVLNNISEKNTLVFILVNKGISQMLTDMGIVVKRWFFGEIEGDSEKRWKMGKGKISWQKKLKRGSYWLFAW